MGYCTRYGVARRGVASGAAEDSVVQTNYSAVRTTVQQSAHLSMPNQSGSIYAVCMYVISVIPRGAIASCLMPVHTCLHCAFDRSVTIIVLKQSFRLSPRGPASVSARVGSASGLPVSGSAVTGVLTGWTLLLRLSCVTRLQSTCVLLWYCIWIVESALCHVSLTAVLQSDLSSN